MALCEGAALGTDVLPALSPLIFITSGYIRDLSKSAAGRMPSRRPPLVL
jgi:hypothetical protein